MKRKKSSGDHVRQHGDFGDVTGEEHDLEDVKKKQGRKRCKEDGKTVSKKLLKILDRRSRPCAIHEPLCAGTVVPVTETEWRVAPEF